MGFEVCKVCGKRFYGSPINNHGSYEYIKHTNFSHNIRVLFGRTKNLDGSEKADAIVEEFFTDGNENISKKDAIEFLECFKHYDYPDKQLLDEIFNKIQDRINLMKESKEEI